MLNIVSITIAFVAFLGAIFSLLSAFIAIRLKKYSKFALYTGQWMIHFDDSEIQSGVCFVNFEKSAEDPELKIYLFGINGQLVGSGTSINVDIDNVARRIMFVLSFVWHEDKYHNIRNLFGVFDIKATGVEGTGYIMLPLLDGRFRKVSSRKIHYISVKHKDQVKLNKKSLIVLKTQNGLHYLTEEELTSMIQSGANRLQKAEKQTESEHGSGQQPAVDPKKAIREKSVICLECGKHFKILSKRHLATHGLTPQQYKEKWGFKKNQSLVAKSLSRQRLKKMQEIQSWKKRQDS